MLQCLFLLKNGEIWPPGPISQHGKSQGSWGVRGEMPAMVSRGTCSTTCRGLRLSLVFDTLPPGGILVGIPCSHVPPFHRDHAVGWGGLGESRDKKPGFLVGMGSVARAALPAIWVMLLSYARHPSLPKPPLHSLLAAWLLSALQDSNISQKGEIMAPAFSNPPIHEASIPDSCVLFFFPKYTCGTVSASTPVSLQFFLPS